MKRAVLLIVMAGSCLAIAAIIATGQGAAEQGSVEADRAVRGHNQEAEEAAPTTEAADPRNWKPHVGEHRAFFRTAPDGTVLGRADPGTYCDVTQWMTDKKGRRWVRIVVAGWVRESAVANLPKLLPDGKVAKPKRPAETEE